MTDGCRVFSYDSATNQCSVYCSPDSFTPENVVKAASATKKIWTIADFDKQNDQCSSNPCQNGGLCVGLDNGQYHCFCVESFSGQKCEIYTDECESSPCLNGGTCEDGIWAYVCHCPAGISGESCENIELVCSAIYDNGYGDGYKLHNDKTRSIQPNIVVRDGYECGQRQTDYWYYDLTETIDISKDLKTLTLKVVASSGYGWGYIVAHRVTLKNFPVTITGFSKQSDNYRFLYFGERLTYSKTSSQVSIHVPTTAEMAPGDRFTATFRIIYS